MAVARGHATDVQIDQIPVGPDYGVEFAPESYRTVDIDGVTYMDQAPRERWLTRWNGFDYERVSELPRDAVISFRYDGVRYVHYGERQAA